MVSPFYAYKLSVVYRDVGEVGGGYNSGGFPISYYTSGKNHFHEMSGDVGMAGWK